MSPKLRPSQSPGLGLASFDAKTIGLSAVPTATSEPRAGFGPVKSAIRMAPPVLNFIVTPGSIVSVTAGCPAWVSMTTMPALVACPTRYGTPRSWRVVVSLIVSLFDVTGSRISSIVLPV
jgi:hypothetical protein